MSGDAGSTAPAAPMSLLDRFLDSLEAPPPSPTGGGAAAAAAAMGACLLVMVARASEGEDGGAGRRARSLRERLVALGEADVLAYAGVLAAGRAGAGEPAPGAQTLAEALLAAAEPPAEIAESAASVCELAALVRADARPALRGDVALAGLLGAAAVEGAVRLVEVNLAGAAELGVPGEPGEPAAWRAEPLRERCRAARAAARRALAEAAPDRG